MKTRVLSFLLMTFTSMVMAQTTHYVDVNATGSGDGSSWANAYTLLGYAAANASYDDTILVKAGTYKESINPITQVHIYGGFNGTESYASQSDPEANETILDGDINGDDQIGDTTTQRDNLPYLVHVLRNDSLVKVTLFGFTLQNAFNGGLNQFASGRGSAVIVSPAFSPVMGPCLAYCNIIRCKFIHNTSSAEGGAVYIEGTSSGVVTGAHIDKCLFFENFSYSRGSAIFNYAWGSTKSYGQLTVTNSVFARNDDRSHVDPSVIYTGASSALGVALSNVVNNTFAYNGSAATFVWNGSGNAMTAAGMTFQNNIVWNDNVFIPSNVVGNASTASNIVTVNFENNILETNVTVNSSSGVAQNNNVSDDPLFVDAAQDNYRLQDVSTAIDAGDTTGVSLHFLHEMNYEGYTRYNGSSPDLGAIEFNPTAGVQSKEFAVKAQVYPNPANDLLNIEMEGEKFQATIMDLSGKTMMTSTEKKIEITELPSGTYLIFVETAKGQSKQLFIKL